MSSSFAPYVDHVFAANGKHCATCQCGASEDFFRWKQRQSIVQPTHRPSQLLHSRIVPNNDPAALEVGDNVIPNKTVWFKSVSPRPTKITIRVSSPQRPNLYPSQVSYSLHKHTNSESVASVRGIHLSRINQTQQQPITPLKKLYTKNSVDQYSHSQSTYYTPLHSQRRNQMVRTSVVRQL